MSEKKKSTYKLTDYSLSSAGGTLKHKVKPRIMGTRPGKTKWITEDQWDKANKREPRKQNPNKLKLKSPSGGMGSGMRRFYKGGQARPKRKFGAGRDAPTPKSGKGLSKNVLDNIKPEDIYQLKGSDLEIVLPSKKYKKGGLIKGKPKLAKRGWK